MVLIVLEAFDTRHTMHLTMWSKCNYIPAKCIREIEEQRQFNRLLQALTFQLALISSDSSPHLVAATYQPKINTSMISS